MITFLRLFAASLLGMFMQLLAKSSSMEETAKKANLIYEGFFPFIKRDWKAVAINFITILVTFLIFGDLVTIADANFKGKTYSIFGVFDLPLSIIWNIFIEICFFATGYFGQDFILRKLVKSVQNKLIKEAIDYKTTQADTANGTLDKPTPVQ